MTPEQIKKEQEASKANSIQQVKSIQPDKADIEEPSVNVEDLNRTDPKTSTPITATPSKDSARQYANKVKDYNSVVSEAKSKGIDLDNQQGVPLLDSDKNKIIENVRNLAPKELVNDVVNRINTYAKPELSNVPALDQKRLMDQERKIRRSRWSDALYAFGEGLQGKTANPEAFASTRLQRKKDEEFQNYLNATEKNRIARNSWNNQTTDETIKWLDQQANNERLDNMTREKMKATAEQLRQNLEAKSRQFAETQRHNKAMEAKGGRLSKEDKPIVIKTAKNTYTLKPEEASFYKGEVMKNSEDYRDKYPGWFEKVPKTNDYGQAIEGQFTYKLNPRIKDNELVRAYLEETKEGGQPITEKNQASYFDKYRKAKGLPTSDVPISETIKTGQPKPQNTQPTKTVKSDPLGLGL